MKSLIALAAAAALLAGASAANAQQDPNNMVTGMRKNAAFCGETNKGKELDCRFTTMAACEKEYKAKGGGAICVVNPGKRTTTGAAAGGGAGMKPNKSGDTNAVDPGSSSSPARGNADKQPDAK